MPPAGGENVTRRARGKKSEDADAGFLRVLAPFLRLTPSSRSGYAPPTSRPMADAGTA